MTTSTRRLRARPTAVALSTSGRVAATFGRISSKLIASALARQGINVREVKMRGSLTRALLGTGGW